MITPIAVVAIVSAFLFFPKGQDDDQTYVMSDSNPFPELIEEEIEENETTLPPVPEPIVVDVKGAVQHPGVYSLSEGDRLIDAIHAAGGYLPDADSRMLNHALKLTDEFVVYVPSVGEEPIDIVQTATVGTSAGQNGGRVNINTANEQELMTIPGVGPAKATAIIQYRTDHGLFKTPESLMEVSGIGQKTFEKLESQITVK
ncbi:helix-hairpin-helix domain-containing protein [Sporosarcina soli]|uniref:Helix-hairpin-helix domain-containing protein n=1 Tax=Sporosarcina soli TaxID=334736 RepID=A0ABW0TNM3_9BACL